MGEIIIVPTSHIAEESIRRVRDVIKEKKPDCVAVELDPNRFVAMERGESSNWDAFRSLGAWTFLMFLVMKKVQSWLGKKVGIMPGSDMINAVRTAEKEAIPIAFIDRDIGITLERLRRVSWKEKARLLVFLFKGLTVDSLMAKQGKKVKLDLRKVPPKELIEDVMDVLSRKFPGIYKVLVVERDNYMARRLAGLSLKFGKTVAVVGAAHVPGLEKAFARG
jgi:pheromone shutdown-related protein TraB